MNGIRSLSEFGNPRWAPSPNSALPPSFSIPRLALKLFRENQLSPSSFGISPLPTPHPRTFNVRGFGPPVRFTAPSTWTWVDHMVSGLRLHTQTPYSDSLSLRLRLFNLTSHAIVTRRFILQKARHHPLTGFDLL